MAQQTISGGGAFTKRNIDDTNANFTELYASTAGGTLTSAHLLVGNGSNVATDTAVTGDVTISNAGVTAIGAGKVANAMLATAIQNPIVGVAAGYKIARSAAPVAVTGTSDITTGLTSVLAAVACAESDLDGTNLASVQAVVTGGAGHILLKAWKITAPDNGALVAASAAKNISWIAIGT